jgi:hypothetical protein
MSVNYGQKKYYEIGHRPGSVIFKNVANKITKLEDQSDLGPDL